jgi:hypothetical protein
MNEINCQSNMKQNLGPSHLLNTNQADRASLVMRYMIEDFAGLDCDLGPWQPRPRSADTEDAYFSLGLNQAARGRLHALAGLLEMNRAEIEQWYAEYWLTYTVLAAYAQPLHATGWRLMQLLSGLDGLTQRARTLLPRLRLPGLECLTVGPDTLVMRLREARPRGNCFLHGLLRRTALDFGVEVDLSDAPEHGATAVRLQVAAAGARGSWEKTPAPAPERLPVRRWRAPLSMPERRMQSAEALLAV